MSYYLLIWSDLGRGGRKINIDVILWSGSGVGWGTGRPSEVAAVIQGLGVEEAAGILRHEKEVCLQRVVNSAWAREEPVVQGHFEPPLVLLAEGHPTCERRQWSSMWPAWAAVAATAADPT